MAITASTVTLERSSNSQVARLCIEHMFDTVAPCTSRSTWSSTTRSMNRRCLSSVQRSANRVLRLRGDDHRIVVTVEAHAYDREGAVRAAIQEVAHIYPMAEFEAEGVPRLTGHLVG